MRKSVVFTAGVLLVLACLPIDHAAHAAGFNASDEVDDAKDALKGLFKKKSKKKPAPDAAAKDSPTAGGAHAGEATLKTYSNYDFVPGEKVLFEDSFLDDQDGEFPAHWTLTAGQGVMNQVKSEPAFFLTEGNYARVAPRMKTTKNYLPADFTIELDFYPTNASQLGLLFKTTGRAASPADRQVFFGKSVSTSYFPNEFSADYPGDREGFDNQWHHVAFIKKGSQFKFYLDQYRVLVVPDCEDCDLGKVEVGGIGTDKAPLVFRNFRLAEGGGANMIGKKFTDAKLVTHGINFDVDKATLKPESMGTLNMIVRILKDNTDIKFEVDGHTDNSGGGAHNLTLSQARADAVKAQLITLGVDAARLTAKGLGDTKPLSGNDTPEGRANNRRVEFVKTP